MTGNVLEARAVTKQFGGLVAVSNVDFVIPEGQIVSLIGPNGAGKTTFFNVIAGLYRPTSGTISFGGNQISGLPPHRITGLGIARTFQNIRLFQNMSAIENVMVGHHSRMRATPFEAILPLRADAAMYAGEETAAQQRGAYPEIKPQVLSVPPDEAFERALAVTREMGWEIVAAEKSEGRIEATDTTFWFGFKDDVVIRIQPVEAGSRMDVRSASRVGVGDLGVNAARIRRFLERLQGQG